MFNFQPAISRVPFAFSRLYSRALWISNSFNDISMSTVATTSSPATSSYAKPYRKVSRESTQEIVAVDSKPRERHMSSKDLKKSSKEVQQEVEKVDSDKDLACLKDDDKLMKLTVAELRGLMRKLGMPPTGRKQDLILALKNFLQNKSADQIPKKSIPKEENKFLTEFTPDHQGTHETKGQVKSLLVSSLKDSMTSAFAARNDGKLQVAIKNVRNHKKQCSPINKAVDVIAQQSSLQKETIILQEPLMKIANHDCEAHTVEPIHEYSEKVNIPSQTVSKKGLARRKRKATESIHKSKIKDGISAAKVEQSCNFEEPWTMLVHKKPQDGWVVYNPATMRLTSPVENTNMIRLISWNVNGLRALLRRKDENSFFQLSKTEKFDILCLQETKLQEKDVELIKQDLLDGYEYSFWTCSVSKLGYSGTAVISRIKPLSVKFGLGVPDHDAEGRLITIELDQFYLVAGYVPNSGQKLERLTYRVQQWDPALSNYIKDLEQKKPVVLTGDLNCAHEEIDIYNPDGNRRSAGFTNEERRSFEDNFLNKGFVDSFRHQHPNSVGYTYWGYRQGARSDNRGWRLDYFLVSNSIVDNVYDSYILPEVNGSDHCPIGLILKL